MTWLAIDAARVWVEPLYEDRRDKLGFQEWEHIQAVANAVTENCRAVAYLHDTVEDGLLTFREVYNRTHVVQFEAILLLTRDGKGTYMDYIRRLRDASGYVGHMVREIKNADLNHNMTRPSPEDMTGMRLPGGRYDRAQKVLNS